MDLTQSLRLSAHLHRASHGWSRQFSTTRLKTFSTTFRQKYASYRDRNDGRERVVILGSGWAGYVFARNLDPKKYKITIVSPRTYFVFTPLLTDTAVGTLEFRHVLEAVRNANSDVEYIQGWADDVNFVAKTIDVEPSVLDPAQSYALNQAGEHKENMLIPEEEQFVTPNTHLKNHIPMTPVKYDKLVVTVGSYNQTFNTPGVKENAHFLKDVGDARKVRKRILELFELCHMPFVSDETRKQLLHFCIVGAGPTGMEFAGNLDDLIRQDLSKMHPDLIKFVKITLYDVAPKVLPMFDAALADYAKKTHLRQNIDIKTSHRVEELRKGPPHSETCANNQDKIPPGRVLTLRTTEGGEVGCGMCVWSTGLMNNPFVAKALNHVRRFPIDSAKITEGGPIEDKNTRQWVIQRHPKSGAIIVDDHLRVQLQTEPCAKNAGNMKAVMQDVFALGDCTNIDGVTPPLPATAQVANQEGLYLAAAMNKNFSTSTNKFDDDTFQNSKAFDYRSRGVMTFLGGSKAVLQGPKVSRKGAARGLKGFIAYAIWRGAYLTMTLSWRNRFLIPIQWFAVKIFGRSISRF